MWQAGVMSGFEFVFTLFGLLLGLSLAEVLAGFLRTVKARRAVRIGWLTPLLGIFVMLDLVTFWDAAWGTRTAIPNHFGSLVVGLMLSGAYYLLAGLIFPDRPEEWPDLDAWYLEHRRLVLGGVAAINVLVVGALFALQPIRMQPLSIAIQASYFALAALAWWTRSKRVGATALAGLIALYLGIAALTFAAAAQTGEQPREKQVPASDR